MFKIFISTVLDISGLSTGCPTSYQIVNRSKLRFRGQNRKFKENELFRKIE